MGESQSEPRAVQSKQHRAPELEMPAPKVAPKVAPKPHRAPEPAPVDTKDRKPSLKEMPSYLKEVSVALTRREELLKLRERMSSAKIILEKDPSAKPWLLSRSISNSSMKDEAAATSSVLSRKMSRESRSSAGSSSDHSED